ncbi:G-type lectin S-receptor-like serine/threonine-protein kinase [Dorcoceras hygrometricum]|uniref:non-specific serine/threonine protein kinase n=1 Tax=Dorcoceras hygrometricum TaxID=472368 RepID=A0A2Z7D8Q9_9LAMI|nr:G-type lectin S-receptor-like serine/threonine-protein kinase [Dorcoceras hygrometricum]
MLVSSGQYFKLGFFSRPVNSTYRYVGIMYNSIPEMTVIWVANRERPSNDLNGSLQISGDRRFVILDREKEILWSCNVSSCVVNSSAELLDTGNLAGFCGRILNMLQMIPKMKFFTDLSRDEKNTLTSWTSPCDLAPGRFTSPIEPLPIPQLFVWNGFAAAEETLRFDQLLGDSGLKLTKTIVVIHGPANSSYRYVGIMYNVPVMTVIWVANRENPLNDPNGSVQISGDGDLVILDGEKEVVWSSNASNPVANSSVQLLDTGNLVLQDTLNLGVKWQSFEHASDSWLPKMKFLTDPSMNEKIVLTSWRSPSDPALGRFTSTIEPIEIPQLFVWNGQYPYWRSGPWNGHIFTGIPGAEAYYQNGFDSFDVNGFDSFDVVNDNPETAYLTFSSTNVSILRLFALSTSGILQHRAWANGTQEWEVIWSSIGTECDIYGKCGPFGICDARSNPVCSCLQGFVPKIHEEWNAANWTGGCTRETPLQCQNNSSIGGIGKKDGFRMLKRVKLPDHFKRFSASEEDCRNQCSNDCSCIAYAFVSGIGCLRWTGSLIDMQNLPSGDTDVYIRLAHSELAHKKYMKAIIAAIAVLGFIIVLVGIYFFRKRLLKYTAGCKGNHASSDVVADKGYMGEIMLRCDVLGIRLEKLPLFKFEMLAKATDHFHSTNKLGQGGFGPVYKGKLPNGQEVAIKRLVRSSNQGLKEFVTEVEVMSKLQHRNLVKILGCCLECGEKMLVYEYMPCGSLDGYIFDSHKQAFLDWNRRVNIIEGICRGILYLHRDSRLRIIHRDLKAGNILLDEELNPKISDFGTARIFGGNDVQANTTRVVGTRGYMAPEYVSQGRFSEKTDVYSFGVMLLEIVSGKENNSFQLEDQEQMSLIAYAWKQWQEGDISCLIDPVIFDTALEIQMMRYVQVGLLCVQETAKDRPCISIILSMLNNEIAVLPRPMEPAFTADHRPQGTRSSDILIENSSKTLTSTFIEG